MPLDIFNDRLNEIAFNARAYYLGRLSEQRLRSLMQQLQFVLTAGASELPPFAETDPPTQARPLNGAELYSALESSRFPKLIALQREIGAETLLATLLLLEVEQDRPYAALEAWGRLEQIRSSRSKASAGKRKDADKTAKDVLDRAHRLLANGRRERELARLISGSTGYTPSQIRRILKKYRHLLFPAAAGS